MKNKIFKISILILSFIFIGCSNKTITVQNNSFPKESFSNKDSFLYEALNSQYNEWRGTKYKFGGVSKNGIDCSAFVQRTYKDKLNIKIPRTTALQSKIGKNIDMSNLKMGDLIFFKTGFNSRHVGIYLKDGKFLHASTKRGVTVSKLNNIYYSKHFWKIRRVIH
jgi:cell wall-associated NlpC family hydrolase